MVGRNGIVFSGYKSHRTTEHRGRKKRKATNGREQKFTELNREKTGEAYRGDRERITQKKEQRNREGEKKQRNDTETRISPTIVFVPSSQN
jgi:L-asparaginase/Glu-tRNA(Gln) amidotransferase subunit D